MSRLFARLWWVDGWFNVVDATLFGLISGTQRARRITGDILEIGAFKGKSAIFLGACLDPGERLIVCDLFGSPALRQDNRKENRAQYAGLGRKPFESNYLWFHTTLPDIHQCPSSELTARLTPDSFRFVHVDGSHLFDEVHSDILLSQKISCPGAIAAFDDYRTRPGVAAAVWQEVASGRLRPRLLTNWKLYGAWDGKGVSVLEQGLDSLGKRGDVAIAGPLDVGGQPVWHVESNVNPSAWRGLVRELAPPALYQRTARLMSRARVSQARRRARRARPESS